MALKEVDPMEMCDILSDFEKAGLDLRHIIAIADISPAISLGFRNKINLYPRLHDAIKNRMATVFKGIKSGHPAHIEVIDSIGKVISFLPEHDTETAQVLLNGMIAIAHSADNYTSTDSLWTIRAFDLSVIKYFSIFSQDNLMAVLEGMDRSNSFIQGPYKKNPVYNYTVNQINHILASALSAVSHEDQAA